MYLCVIVFSCNKLWDDGGGIYHFRPDQGWRRGIFFLPGILILVDREILMPLYFNLPVNYAEIESICLFGVSKFAPNCYP